MTTDSGKVRFNVRLTLALGLLALMLAPHSAMAGCDGGCVSPSCVAPWCDTCIWCLTGDIETDDEDGFGGNCVIPKGYKKGKQKIVIPCPNGVISRKICHLVPWLAPPKWFGATRYAGGIRVLVSSNGGKNVSDTRYSFFQNGDTDTQTIDPDGVVSPLSGTEVSVTLVTIGDRQFAKVCFDFSKRNLAGWVCPSADQVITISRLDWYLRGEEHIDVESNRHSFSVIGQNNSGQSAAGVAPKNMADTVTFKATFARYKGDVFQFERLNGPCGIYQDGVLQRVDQIVNGELTVEMPTDVTTNWEFSFDNIGAFILRFEFVDGFLYVYDEMRDDRETLYFQDPDGTYNLEYWDSANQIMITGKTVDENATLMPLPFYQISD